MNNINDIICLLGDDCMTQKELINLLEKQVGVIKTRVHHDKKDEKITDITKKIYRIFELSGIVRIDYMMVFDEVLVNEINTTPGSLAYYLFEDKILDLLEKQIKTALFNFQNKKNPIFESSILEQNYSIKK
jgi:predicted ATP-grasp superfamily ATP-dependent carboligase